MTNLQRRFRKSFLNNAAWISGLALLTLAVWLRPVKADDHKDNDHGHGPRTPIQHVIVVVGENHTFDNVFGGYVPQHGQSVLNLLSQHIVNPDGSPGPQFRSRHRFFQMWQQYDGGRADLFQWVAETVGIGPQNSPPAPSPANTFQGGLSMGFFNMNQGDAPFLKFIADNYAIGDNYHQGIMGGTGANFIYLGTADVGFFSDGSGNPAFSSRSRDNLPNPTPSMNPYVPGNRPAIGDLMNVFDFDHIRRQAPLIIP